MTPRTGRPQGAGGDSARTRLLNAADQLFYEQGIAATGVDAVLGLAHVAPATLYAHFKGKDDLVASYLQSRHEVWRTVWDEALQRAGEDARERLLSVFDALADLSNHHGRRRSARGCAFLAAAVEVVTADHPAHRWLVADTLLLRTRLLHLAVEAGVSDPPLLAEQLLVLYDGALAAQARHAVTGGPSASGGDLASVRLLAASLITQHRPPQPENI